MSANVESMAAVSERVTFLEGGVPWHDDATMIDDEDLIFDVDRFGEAAGVNWEVRKVPLTTVVNAQRTVNYARENPTEEVKVVADTDHNAIVRMTDGSILGTCGKTYAPLQNNKALEFFRPWCENKILALNTAGSLMSGKHVFCLAQTVEDTIVNITKKEPLAKFLLLHNSHTGSGALKVGLVFVRVVCCNTLRLAETSAESKILRVRHSSKMEQNLEIIRECVDLMNNDFAATAEKYQYLANKGVNRADLRKYVRILIQGEKEAELIPWDDVSTRSKNIILGIEQRMDSPNQEPSHGTWFAAYNSVNEYLNWEYGNNTSNRMCNLWFGKNSEVDKKALLLALKMAGLT